MGGLCKTLNTMDWKQLKEFCNSLDEKQLEHKVILWREEEAINEIEPEVLNEAHYINVEAGEDACYPESEATEPLKDLKKVYEKGDPILHEIF